MTGGGTSGHITPNIALFPALKEAGFDIIYLGTRKGLEYNLINEQNIPFFEIEAGKLRRYIDIENIKDISKIFKGSMQAYKILKKEKPDVIFSKGGFVSCPVVWAASLLKIPVILHESDFTPGLANKLCIPFASKICYSFPETAKFLPSDKSIYTGMPVRDELTKGNKTSGIEFCGFKDDKPVLTIIGGSLGSAFLNEIVRANLKELLQVFNICHICGKSKLEETLLNVQGYCQHEYISKELNDVFAATDLFVSRSGATVIFELLALNKPMLLIPLSKKASRGDQILNATSFYKSGYADFVEEDNLTVKNFLDKVFDLYKNQDRYTLNQSSENVLKNTDKILSVINTVLKERK
ncbi:MAG: undecaprenyldiphospho-muramoylpentapeptide beta-N-acetylglucosaminyltransferase [Clostridia bacterium]|nr:undecaprenyldiphospho-muramoylpentapeptide beta-N-acetylglucosaminyltransferase [Clostridia bacterium]